jgi:hypothetical protein
MLELFIKVYFGSLYIFAAYASLYLYLHKYKRSSLKEIADYSFCPFWKEIQYDMGLLTKINIYWNGSPLVHFESAPKEILDIGSGNGVTSVNILTSLFDKKVKITLSDINPNLEAWNKLSGIEYLIEPIDIRHDTLNGYSMISLFNSLHHLDENSIDILLKKAKKSKASVFIMDAQRLSPIHPLLIPNFYYLIYVVLTLAGIYERRDYFKIKSFLQLIVEPWIMCVDQIIGSTRRYHLDTVKEMANTNGFHIKLYQDSLMNYIILTC